MRDEFVVLQKQCRWLEHRIRKLPDGVEKARLQKELEEDKERLAQMIADKEAQ